ncbi:MAG: ribosome recycling factor [Clostridia bacterium]|nr:ribosome recycling factor [Clostridia bacterium]MBR5767443.1 ribosome recycling factor [Clostridia bacterium]
MKFNTSEFEEKMKKSIASYESELGTVRVGRASAAVLDKITVEYYGSPAPINTLAQITTPDARTLAIQPWDASTLKSIERAILASDLGITPQNDGKVIRLAFPMLTEERRKELSKQVSKMGEGVKVAIRNIRRDAVEKAKAMQKKSELTEDDEKVAEKDIQTLTDKYIKKVDEVTEKKQKDIMSI